jgi:hypothetical protein
VAKYSRYANRGNGEDNGTSYYISDSWTKKPSSSRAYIYITNVTSISWITHELCITVIKPCPHNGGTYKGIGIAPLILTLNTTGR